MKKLSINYSDSVKDKMRSPQENVILGNEISTGKKNRLLWTRPNV